MDFKNAVCDVAWAVLAKPIKREVSENANDAPRSSAHPTLLSII